jgi:glycosyltransferase involved in cell wall biosynthesis
MTDKSFNRSSTFYLFAYWHDARWKRFVGATVKIWDLAHNLNKDGHAVVLFVPKCGLKRQGIPFTVVEIPYLDAPFLRFLSFNLLLMISVLRLGILERPDVIYVRRMNSVLPGLISKMIRAVFFFEVNDDPYRKTYDEGSRIGFSLRTFLSRLTDEINLRLCSRAFVISQSVMEKVRRCSPKVERWKLRVMPSGANVDLFKPLSMKACRASLGVDEERKCVCFSGTLLNHQGVDVLVDAAPGIVAKEPSSHFYILGEGPMKEHWIKRAAERNLGDRFHFVGEVSYEEMPVWLSAMDVCVAPFLPSAGLRSPVKIFDYLACGKPVVASKIEGTTDIFEGSSAVVLVSPGEAGALRDSILALLSDAKKCEAMGSEGRAFVTAKYDRAFLAREIMAEAEVCLRSGIRKELAKNK